jgi:hypothetical protein
LSFHGQPSGGCRASDECKHYIEAPQWLPGPIDADVTEQSVLDRIPLGATRRIMANGDA